MPMLRKNGMLPAIFFKKKMIKNRIDLKPVLEKVIVFIEL